MVNCVNGVNQIKENGIDFPKYLVLLVNLIDSLESITYVELCSWGIYHLARKMTLIEVIMDNHAQNYHRDN